MDDQTMGRRVAYWRNRRKMSQQLFADRLGKSKSWVDKVERGVRRLDRFSVIHEIADVLQLDVQVLMGRDPVRRPDPGIDSVEVEAIRAALERYDKVGALTIAPSEPPTLNELTKAVSHAWLTFQHSKYTVLAQVLPKLLRDTQAANAAYEGEQGRLAAHLLAQVYQISSSALRKVGEYDLAWLAADRATVVCRRAEDELLAATATSRVTNALSALGRHRAGLEIAVNVASKVGPGGKRKPTPERLSVYGILLLQGAMAAARQGDATTVRDLIDAAEEAANLLGRDDNHYWTCFGPTNVLLHKAAAAVEMGDGAQALETHNQIDPDRFAAMMPERRAHHLLDMSRGLVQIGDVGRASEFLIEADRLAPNEVRCRPIAHELITELLRRTRGSGPSAVVELADHLGLTA